MLPALRREHEVLTPSLDGPETEEALVDAMERTLDDAGYEDAHLVGNSLGGWVALRLAARGRARSVVALAPAGGWMPGDRSYRVLLHAQTVLPEQARSLLPHVDRLVATPAGRRQVTREIVERYEHIPPDLLADQLRAVANARSAGALAEQAREHRWELDAARIECPVRIVWGTADRLLPWPSAAARFRKEWLPHAEWIELEGVGHCPQLDVPLETSQLILGM